MIKMLSGIALSILLCDYASAQESGGFACLDDVSDSELVVAFQQSKGGHIAVVDGDIRNPYPASLNGSENARASFEGPNFMAVLSADLTLNFLSERHGLKTFSCVDITQAARTLNNDFGALTNLIDSATELERELAETDRANKTAKSRIAELERLIALERQGKSTREVLAIERIMRLCIYMKTYGHMDVLERTFPLNGQEYKLCED